MAIRKDEVRKLLADVDVLFGTALPVLPESLRSWVQDKVMGEALSELRRLVEEMREPVFYIVGRAGHGKSSLINALVGRKVAEVGAGPDAVSPAPKEYPIEIKRDGAVVARWKCWDSRGLFDLKPPAGAPEATSEQHRSRAIQEIVDRKPDVILHVLQTPSLRDAGPDLELLREIRRRAEFLPIITVLTNPEGLLQRLRGGDVGSYANHWTPEKSPDMSALLADHVRAWADKAGSGPRTAMGGHDWQGLSFDSPSEPLQCIIPASVAGPPYWNVDRVKDVIFAHLPEAARLDFLQGLGRREKLKELAGNVVASFSNVAGAVGAVPIPIADIWVLTSLQSLMIAVVAGLSCRAVTLTSATEFLAASGASVGAGLTLREVARQVTKFMPFAGIPASAVIAANGTRAIGNSAIAYFFNNDINKIENLQVGKDASGKTPSPERRPWWRIF